MILWMTHTGILTPVQAYEYFWAFSRTWPVPIPVHNEFETLPLFYTPFVRYRYLNFTLFNVSTSYNSTSKKYSFLSNSTLQNGTSDYQLFLILKSGLELAFWCFDFCRIAVGSVSHLQDVACPQSGEGCLDPCFCGT